MHEVIGSSPTIPTKSKKSESFGFSRLIRIFYFPNPFRFPFLFLPHHKSIPTFLCKKVCIFTAASCRFFCKRLRRVHFAKCCGAKTICASPLLSNVRRTVSDFTLDSAGKIRLAFPHSLTCANCFACIVEKYENFTA